LTRTGKIVPYGLGEDMKKRPKDTRKKKKKKRIIILAGAGFALILLLLGSIEVTSHSNFCSTCHYMKPFYRSWQTSSHKDVECSTCHYPPGLRSKLRAKVDGLMQLGRYWTKLYLKSKPWAEIPDEACLREGCHDKRLLEGRVNFSKIVFDHKIHFEDLKRGKRLRCTSCHSQIVQGEHITVTNSTCFICHFKESEHYPKISECSHCHSQENLTSENTSRYNHSLVFENGFKCDKCHSHTIIGDGDVPRENCYKCHWETDRLEKFDDTDLMHSTHIFSHKIECNQCHLEIQHKIVKDIETLANCQACHTGSHKAQKILFTGEGGKGPVHPMPNIMFEKGLSCKGCHIFHEEKGGQVIKSETFTSRAAACESCHGRGFSRILREWEISTSRKLKQIKNVYAKARDEIARSGHTNKEKAQTMIEEAAFNIDVVERGKSVHNMTYSLELLKASYDILADALGLIKSTYLPEAFIGAAEEVPTQCSSCHAGIEEINTQVFGLNFPHKRHLTEQKIQCSVCHSNAVKHGEFIATKQSCAVCHHRDSSKDCTICHRIQTQFYQGGLIAGDKIPEDMMFEAEVDCSGCHLDSRNQIYRSDKDKCLDCHEQGYDEILLEWQNSIKELVSDLESSLKETKALKLSPAQQAEIQKMEQILQKVKLDGSLGVHNFSFIEEFLTNSIKTLKSLQKVLSHE